ncbi:MAG TPA: c-type cytochrome, partial [Pyrinomonadaceae bacterium]
IDRKVALIDDQLTVISDEFQDRRGRITVKNYQIESADAGDKAEMRQELQQMKAQKARFEMPSESGRNEQKEFDYAQLEGLYNDLKREKAALLTERGEKLKPVSDLRRQRDEYLKNNVAGVTEDQVKKLLAKNENFEVKMRQINIQGDQVVDRCETCHLGTREPLEIDAGDMMSAGRRNRPDQMAKAFVSHPSKELLQIHDPEKFGCASCHGGNGRATTSIEKGHGRHRFWLHPMYERDNMEAGCQQCHMQDRVLVGSPILNKGKDLFTERGCVGCHRYEGFDRETDSLAVARQEIKQLEEQVAANRREALSAQAKRDESGISDEENQRLLAQIESLTVTSSQIESRVDQLNIQSRYLMQDQKKVGPNLKDVRIKLVKEWIPEWLKDPQSFRPGTKMPTFWYLSGKEGISVPPARQEEERKAISAYLWQSAFDGRLPQQPTGNAATGKQLFETRGCLACHSIGDGESVIGAEFAANLQKVGQKANYEYLVRWVHNPRERTSPYCPKERKDLTPADYAAKNLPYVFDANHSKCPNDGAELQIQNMTVMPNFRLSDQDSRDIATYLKSLSPPATYPDASYMDDPALKAKGGELIKTYGCAGCHEIRGFEEEQRIGKELTTEGATPLERLDFALMTHEAEDGHDPLNLYPEKKNERWYNHKGFFERKIEDPSIYDRGKEKEPQDHLRMPEPFMKDDWRAALTTFLLGSKGDEGSNVPKSFYYTPNSLQKDIQDGWWVVKKYNCMGCHQIQVGQERPALTRLPWYEEAGELGKRQWPPGLLTEGARVDPNWLLRFLRDPSLSGLSEEELTAHSAGAGATRAGGRASAGGASGATTARPAGAAATASTAQLQPAAPASGQASQPAAGGSALGLPPQPGENINGLRRNLAPRMPTFNFSPNELRILVRFFMAYASQQEPYIKERIEPLTPEETSVARAFFSSGTQPCLSCHLTGDPTHDQTAYAPNFLDAAQRLKPAWTLRWILDPPKIW